MCATIVDVSPSYLGAGSPPKVGASRQHQGTPSGDPAALCSKSSQAEGEQYGGSQPGAATAGVYCVGIVSSRRWRLFFGVTRVRQAIPSELSPHLDALAGSLLCLPPAKAPLPHVSHDLPMECVIPVSAKAGLRNLHKHLRCVEICRQPVTLSTSLKVKALRDKNLFHEAALLDDFELQNGD
jgi:hypothetical protein